MTDVVHVKKFNESYIMVWPDEAGILFELSDFFSFYTEGYKFSPKYNAGVWDGKIYLYDTRKKLLHGGLFNELKDFCDARNYRLEVEECPAYGLPSQEDNIHEDYVKEYVDGLNIHSKGVKLTVKDYQYQAIHVALRHKGQIILSPTGSGKSLLIYSIVRHILDDDSSRVLIIVPTTTLVHQMYNDFADYSSHNDFDVESNCHIIMAGKEKNTKKRVVISTWQSLLKIEQSWLSGFSAVVSDEVHLAKSAEISKIILKCADASYRLGFTGSLDKSKTNRMVLRGLFGPITRVTTTRKLMDEGDLSTINVKTIVLDYSKETKTLVKKFDYAKEVDFLCQHERRNKFIRNLVISLEGNTLVLFNFVEKHGKILYEMIKERAGDRSVFFVHGNVDSVERDEVRGLVGKMKNAIIVASFGSFSTGTNIPNLNNIVFSSPTKSIIRVLQSIGRGTRLAEGKNSFVLYDVMDKLSDSKTKSNHTYTHGIERLRIYSKEGFPYRITEVKIEQ